MGAGISSDYLRTNRGPFKPTPGDVRLAQAYLSSPGLLPPELAWVVLEYACVPFIPLSCSLSIEVADAHCSEYWVTETFHSRTPLPTVSAGVAGHQQQAVALRTSAIHGGGASGLEQCVRRISVRTLSKDQGTHGGVTVRARQSAFQLTDSMATRILLVP